jgi:phosphoribosylaminoimidazole-succinocarboxamide synthase
MRKKKKLYDGKTKVLYETSDADHLIIEFKDDIVSPDGTKKAKVKGKGAINNQISGYLFRFLESYHLPTHFVRVLSDTTMLVRKLDMVPIAVVVHNVATGKIARRQKVKEGRAFDKPLLQFYKKEAEGDGVGLREEDIIKQGLVSREELDLIRRYCTKANVVLKDFCKRRGIVLVSLRLELGRNKSGKLVAGDEISPDTCHFWDAVTGERYDIDVFVEDLGDVGKAYEHLRKRMFREEGVLVTVETAVGVEQGQE